MIADNVGKPKAVPKCAVATKRKGFWIFGVQYNGQCFSANDAQYTFSQYGRARNCKNGKGGDWANDVYFFGKIQQTEPSIFFIIATLCVLFLLSHS